MLSSALPSSPPLSSPRDAVGMIRALEPDFISVEEVINFLKFDPPASMSAGRKRKRKATVLRDSSKKRARRRVGKDVSQQSKEEDSCNSDRGKQGGLGNGSSCRGRVDQQASTLNRGVVHAAADEVADQGASNKHHAFKDYDDEDSSSGGDDDDGNVILDSSARGREEKRPRQGEPGRRQGAAAAGLEKQSCNPMLPFVIHFWEHNYQASMALDDNLNQA